MKSKENIVFLGMMGSGKTILGSLISKKLKKDFFDTDKIIEEELKSSVLEIFKNKGEGFFRETEEKIALKILKYKNCVISLGGGTFLNKKIRKEVLSNHLSFWLKWDNKTLIKRVKNSHKRPIAYKLSDSELINLIKKRSNFYSKALYKVNCENLTKNELAQRIIDIYETDKINS